MMYNRRSRWYDYVRLGTDIGDVFYTNWDDVLIGATAVVSTIGGFGNEEQMKRINGEANVLAVDAAKEYGLSIKSLWYLSHDGLTVSGNRFRRVRDVDLKHDFIFI
ncbi:hypothetical protein IFM89_039133, partial [Coptis chinensis]